MKGEKVKIEKDDKRGNNPNRKRKQNKTKKNYSKLTQNLREKSPNRKAK